jgi:hypothetical protein
MFIAAIKMIGENAISGIVVVKSVSSNSGTACPVCRERDTSGAHGDISSFDFYRTLRQRLKTIFRRPLEGLSSELPRASTSGQIALAVK